MKRLSSFKIVFYSIIFLSLHNCNWQEAPIKRDLIFIQPFDKKKIAVYESPSGQRDSIVFYQATFDTVKNRNLEQGLYDGITLQVKYELKVGSYHKLGNNMSANFLNFIYTSNQNISKEIFFIGLLFDKEAIEKNYDQLKKGELITLDENIAQYKNLNVTEGIKSIKFSSKSGVVSFVDSNNKVWRCVHYE